LLVEIGSVQVIKTVAAGSAIRPSVCRKCYVHPGLLECYLSGAIAETFKNSAKHRPSDCDFSARQEAAFNASVEAD
jgi:DNA topoisomerase-1